MLKPLARNRKGLAHANLQPGDPWTFIRDQPLVNAETGQPLKPGDMIVRRFEPDGRAHLFEIRAVHFGSIYETIYRGLQADGRA